MSYLKFDKTQLINLNYSLKREFLRSNRAGSFGSSTLIFCNTRKYHGLLICPLEKLDGQKHVLLSSLDETIIQHNKEFHIGSRKYPSEYHPLGHKYLEDFYTDPMPSHIYRVGGVILKKEAILCANDERILLRYTLLDAHSPTRIRFQPYLAFRQIHKLSKANLDVNTKYEPVQNGIKVKLYEGYPYLFMQISQETDYIHAPDWYYNVEYIEELKRGYEGHEDLMAIGFFELPIGKGQSIIFSAGTTVVDPAELEEMFEAEAKKRTPRNNYENCLENAAQQFFIQKGKDLYITAGFPWFDIWARDTFIALPGLSLARGEAKLAKQVLLSMSKHLKDGLFPNQGICEHCDVNSVDAPLWYIWAIQKYVHYLDSSEGIWKTFGAYIKQILQAYKQGTHYGIQMRPNGLIYAGIEGKSLTWMDAIVEGVPVTQRLGYDVEVQALWYNAVNFALEIAQKAKDNEFIEEWKDLPEKIKGSFLEMFWDEIKGYLADYVNDYEGHNFAVRPNQIMAASMYYSMLSIDQMQRMLNVVEKELLTPRGIRTLSPRDSNYKGHYEGNQTQRDLAYHQGTAWPWLLGQFVEAYLKVYEKSGIAFCERLYLAFEEEMTNAGIGTISEIYDGDPPHDARGAISQAWSVGEIFRIKCMIDKLKNKK